MTQENFLKEFKRDFGYGRCDVVPDEMVQLLLNGEEDRDDEDDFSTFYKE